jgi:hypothetical protein
MLGAAGMGANKYLYNLEQTAKVFLPGHLQSGLAYIALPMMGCSILAVSLLLRAVLPVTRKSSYVGSTSS